MEEADQEIVRRWVADLRSGRYQQGKGHLRQELTGRGPAKHCCLGVLCEQAVSRGVVARRRYLKGQIRPHYLDPSDPESYPASSFPPAPVLQWSGVSREFMNSLSLMNDIGATFDEIADAIERELLPDDYAARQASAPNETETGK